MHAFLFNHFFISESEVRYTGKPGVSKYQYVGGLMNVFWTPAFIFNFVPCRRTFERVNRVNAGWNNSVPAISSNIILLP